MRAPGWKTAIVSSLIAAMLLTSCSTRTSPTTPNANGDGSTVDTAAAAVDIADINVCAWVRAEAQMPAVTLGNISSQEVDPDASQRVIELADGTKQVTCNVDGLNDEIMLYPHTVATITLTSGAPMISDEESTLTDPYSYKGLKGVFAVGDDSLGGAQIAVQLDDTTVLSVEGFASVSNSDDETVAKLGVFPLTSRLVDAWTQNKVPVNPEGSFFAAGDLCGDVDLASWDDRLGLPEGDVVGRYSQSGREINTSDGEIGSITCGTFGYASAAREADWWPWNEPESFGHPSVSFTATEFPDDSTASDYAARYSTSTDCSGAVAVGSPALMCDDGSGMASRRGADGAWASLSGISLEPTDADALAVAMDETSAQMLALAGTLPELSTDDVVDPRDVPIVSSSTPPDGATCPDGSDPAGVQATEHATVMICTDPDTGASTWSGDVDGVEFTLDGTCGSIDASKWDGPADATVCQEYNAISVLDVQNVPTTYFREYFTAKWSTDQFGGGE